MTWDPFAHAGPLEADYRRTDWTATPLGPVEEWPPHLRAAVDLVLNSSFAITLLWGPDLRMLWNAAYGEVTGKPATLIGRPCEEVFGEAWHQIGPLLARARRGEVLDFPAELVPIESGGHLRDRWWTFCYSPVRAPDGRVDGVIDIVTEITTAVVVARRLDLLRRLHAELASVDHPVALLPVARRVLADAVDDLPWFTLRAATGAGAAAGGGSPDGGRDGLRGRPDAWADGGAPAPLAADRVERDDEGPVVVVPVRGAELRVRPNPRVRLDEDYLDHLRLVGFTLTQHADRLATREAERRVSTALQLSLLTPPAPVEGLELAVRYEPSSSAARVGGDWYDGFPHPASGTVLVIGDVSGHGEVAASQMGQIRSMTRAVAHATAAGPASVLDHVDRALEGLGLDVLATAVVACVEVRHDGRVDLAWSNAGHLPPLLLRAGGGVEVLDTEPEPLLGLHLGGGRSEHRLVLDPGDTLLLYTDGLVERRAEVLDDGIHALASALAAAVAVGPVDVAQVCTAVTGPVGVAREDDVATMLVHVPVRD